jgi:hypothetical protein
MDDERSPYELLIAERSRDRAEIALELRGLTTVQRAAWWSEPNRWLAGTRSPAESLLDDPDAVVRAAELAKPSSRPQL